MPIAAPRYVTNHPLAECPPGHQFSMYFDVWNAEWKIADGAKGSALSKILRLGDGKPLLLALRERQAALAMELPKDQCMVVDAVSTSPFATGLGNEHPIENGFAFLSPYGLPYLSASGVKGVVRRAAEERRDAGQAGFTRAAIETLFGPEDRSSTDEGPHDEERRRRGAVAFWDVLPDPEPTRGELIVEIMTPHYGDYYQGKASPHDAGQPNPIPFLAVPAGARFRFIVTVDPALLAPAVELSEWKGLLRSAFAHAFDWLGFGAKTAVGYGALKLDERAELEAAERSRKHEEVVEKQRRKAEREQALAALGPVDRAVREFLDARADKSQPEISALIGAAKQGRFDQVGKKEVAERIRALMQAQKRWREKSQAKKPKKDRDYQDTLLVKSWIDGR